MELDNKQREAVARLDAPRFRFMRYWDSSWATDTEGAGRGLHFYPQWRRTWTFHVHGYPVIVISGRVTTKRPPPVRQAWQERPRWRARREAATGRGGHRR